MPEPKFKRPNGSTEHRNDRYQSTSGTSLPTVQHPHSETLFDEVDRIRNLGPLSRWAKGRQLRAVLPLVNAWTDLAHSLTRAKGALADYDQTELRHQQVRTKLALLPLEGERERLALEIDCEELRRDLNRARHGARSRQAEDLPPEAQEQLDEASKRRRAEEAFRADCDEAIGRVLGGRAEEEATPEERARIQALRDRYEQLIAALWEAPL